MPIVHGGSPLTWTDMPCPAHAAGAGAATPVYTVDFIAETGTNDNELRVPVFNAGDRVYTAPQFLHDLHIPSSGTIILRPHVHWTFVAEPTTGRTVIWELRYNIAKINATFAATVSTLTGATYTTTGDAEIRKHFVTALGDVVVNAADCSPSMIAVCNIGLKDTSTIDNSITGMLSFDWHYQIGPRGTNTEYA